MVRVVVSQKQTAGLAPEHILGKSVLKMSFEDLQQFVQSAFCENPALALEENAECPVCHTPLVDGGCPTCELRDADEVDDARDKPDEWPDDQWEQISRYDDGDTFEPFAGVAAPCLLSDHLKEQIHAHFSEADIQVAEFIVDSLDEDGYLREQLFETASRFGLSVPQLESVLKQVQRLDPPGIAARDLRECLMIQLEQLDVHCEDSRNAEMMIRERWQDVSRMRLDEVAQHIGITKEAVESALRFVRERLNPHPSSMFRDPWQKLAPRRTSKQPPDVVIRCAEDGLEAEVVDPVSGRVSVDKMYVDMFAKLSAKQPGLSESDRAHIKESVTKALAVIEALEFRRSSLRRIAGELLRCQERFFMDGPSALRPLTKKELAARIGLHESTVCRATQDKTLRLPSGDVVSFDVLFDSALPTRELVRQFAAQRLSDGQIAKKLNDAGIQIARRTVAKYRDQLRLPPIDLRLATHP